MCCAKNAKRVKESDVPKLDNRDTRRQRVVVCAQHTCSASTIFQYSGCCRALLEMCNNLEKLTRGYFLTLLTFGCGALTLKSGSQSPCRLVSADDSFSRCVKLLAEPVLTTCFAFFLSLFLSSRVHDSLLPYTAIFQLSTAQ